MASFLSARECQAITAEKARTPEMFWRENIYGHLARLKWIKSHITPGAKVLEFGCGTGCMVTLPLLTEGVDICGIDRSKESITYGREIFFRNGFAVSRLRDTDLADVDQQFDMIVASEVLEHVCDSELSQLFSLLRRRLKASGKLLITVPNGYGVFELDSFLYFKAGFGRLAERTRINRLAEHLKARILGYVYRECPYVATLDSSPHVQRFTHSSIRALLTKNGFAILDCRGSTLVSGPFCHMLLSGYESVMGLNNKMGARFPAVAAGFYLAASPCATI